MQTTILAQINTLRHPSESANTLPAPMPAPMAPNIAYMMPNASAPVPFTPPHQNHLPSSIQFMAHPSRGGTKQ